VVRPPLYELPAADVEVMDGIRARHRGGPGRTAPGHRQPRIRLEGRAEAILLATHGVPWVP
jgi:hypothetical protein